MGFSREMSIELLGKQINFVLQNTTECECQTEGFIIADMPFYVETLG